MFVSSRAGSCVCFLWLTCMWYSVSLFSVVGTNPVDCLERLYLWSDLLHVEWDMKPDCHSYQFWCRHSKFYSSLFVHGTRISWLRICFIVLYGLQVHAGPWACLRCWVCCWTEWWYRPGSQIHVGDAQSCVLCHVLWQCWNYTSRCANRYTRHNSWSFPYYASVSKPMCYVGLLVFDQYSWNLSDTIRLNVQ